MTRREELERSINNLEGQVCDLIIVGSKIDGTKPNDTNDKISLAHEIANLEDTKLQFILALEEKELVEKPREISISVDQSFFEGKNE